MNTPARCHELVRRKQTCVMAAMLVIMFLGLVCAASVCLAEDDQPDASTFWTTADRLLPAWGFYPLSQSYGGTKPLGGVAAWCAAGNNGQLTWVADFPRDGEYHVWIRKYGGYGQVQVLVDEQPVTGAKGGPGGGRYVWNHAGRIALKKGRHHVDLRVAQGMVDAALFTLREDLAPEKGGLPAPVEQPVLRAFRTYRRERGLHGHTSRGGLVLGSAPAYGETLYDWLPDKSTGPMERLRLWGAAGQYVNGTFAARALTDHDEVTASLRRLQGPGDTVIDASGIDVRVVHVRSRKNSLFRSSRTRLLVPELLLRDDRTDLPPKGKQGDFGGGLCVTKIPAHQSRQFWITIHVAADSPVGIYRGELSLASSLTTRSVPIELEVLPVRLEPAEGYYAIYHRSQPVNPEQPYYVKPERYLAELQDHVRHGLNAATLYGGFATLEAAGRAGMTKAPCLMHWPGGNAKEQVVAAKKLGFEDLYYYGVDEPTKPEQIERCRKEAERRQAAGLRMFTAINSKPAQMATRDFIDRPVYNIYVFGGKNNAEAMYVRERGFRPISYWVTATAYPLPYRAFTGLYNKACGYQGSCPWAYQDYPDDRLYDPENPAHKVSYPDEFGRPIPTLAWEAHRAGIDDVRYLEALDRAIASAARRLEQPNPPNRVSAALDAAKQVRREKYASIRGRWFEYLCSLRPGDLEQTRRELAEAVVRLEKQLAD